MQVLKPIWLFIRTNLWIIPLAALLAWGLIRFLDPAPPRHLVMTTGAEAGAYHGFARLLAERLDAQGLTLELRPSQGSLENLQRLSADNPEVQIGLVQSGTADLLGRTERNSLQALAALYHEPLWLFQRAGEPVDTLADLNALSLSVGSEGSGTWAVAKALFAEAGQQERFSGLNEGRWQALGSQDAAAALLAGELDAAFLVLPADHPLILQLIADPELELADFNQTEALAARLPYLNQVRIPMGLLDIANNLPPRSAQVLSPVATLVVNQDFHPALATLILQETREILREGTLLDAPDAFPAASPLDLPLSNEADYYHRNGVPFLQRFLPFWIASLVDRYVVLLIPFIAIMIPLFRSMGPLYRWRIRARVFRWYGQLRRIDRLILHDEIQAVREKELASLHKLEDDLTRVDVPLSYAHELYTLHLHVRYMISRLEALPADE
ncbi:MAG: C4-dicarboxylate ABC transporter substrate-binding protein [Pseudomonadaceae bacterium]|nr:MAG: C4-dicarboxylate ABC transporter substrate-binding protein [Pseudomonadaceae bacterium]